MSEGSRRKQIQRVVIGLIVVAFMGSSVFGIFAMFGNANQQPGSDLSRAEMIQELQAQEENFEALLVREPENQVALQTLVEIRLQTGDFEGAIAPMEKLVELNPEIPEYEALLTQLKQNTETEAVPETTQEETQIPTPPDN